MEAVIKVALTPSDVNRRLTSKYNKRNHAENEAERLVLCLLFFKKKKTLYEVKASGLKLSFNIFQ